MRRKIERFKIVAWIAGLLGSWGIVASVMGLFFSVVNTETSTLTQDFLPKAIGQLLISVVVVIGSVLFYRERRIGRTILLTVFFVLIVLSLADTTAFYMRSKDVAYVLAAIFFEAVPLGLLSYFVFKTTPRKNQGQNTINTNI